MSVSLIILSFSIVAQAPRVRIVEFESWRECQQAAARVKRVTMKNIFKGCVHVQKKPAGA